MIVFRQLSIEVYAAITFLAHSSQYNAIIELRARQADDIHPFETVTGTYP